MKELFEFTFSSVNIIPTILLLFVSLYWIVVLFGMLDMSTIDLDTDLDVDVDADIDVDADVDADIDADAHHGGEIDTGGGGSGIVMQSLIFFNVGKVPLLILLSFIAIPFWVMALVVNYYLKVDSFTFSLILAVPEFILSLFFAKILTEPIAKLFQKMNDEFGKPEDFTGKTARARFDIEINKDGQIEYNKEGAVIVLTVRTTKDRIEKGTEVIIIDYNEKEKYYLVEPF